MPSTLAGLRSLFQGRHPEQPADLNPDFKVELPKADDEAGVETSSSYVNVDRAGEVFGIEYETPQGSISRRWVSVEGFKKSKAGDWSISAYCFARKGLRSFPLDHVNALFDHQGEPVTLSEIFPVRDGAPASTSLNDQTGKNIIDSCRDGLRVLTALAKIDGKLHQKEVETIVKFADSASKDAGLTMTSEDGIALERYIRNLQPTGDVVAACLDRLSETEQSGQKNLFWFAREVMDADGLQDEAEVKMVLDISEALGKEL